MTGGDEQKHAERERLTSFFADYPRFETVYPRFGARARPTVTRGLLGSHGHRFAREEARALFGGEFQERCSSYLAAAGLPAKALDDLPLLRASWPEAQRDQFHVGVENLVRSRMHVERVAVPSKGKLSESREAFAWFISNMLSIYAEMQDEQRKLGERFATAVELGKLLEWWASVEEGRDHRAQWASQLAVGDVKRRSASLATRSAASSKACAAAIEIALDEIAQGAAASVDGLKAIVAVRLEQSGIVHVVKRTGRSTPYSAATIAELIREAVRSHKIDRGGQ